MPVFNGVGPRTFPTVGMHRRQSHRTCQELRLLGHHSTARGHAQMPRGEAAESANDTEAASGITVNSHHLLHHFDFCLTFDLNIIADCIRPLAFTTETRFSYNCITHTSRLSSLLPRLIGYMYIVCLPVRWTCSHATGLVFTLRGLTGLVFD